LPPPAAWCWPRPAAPAAAAGSSAACLPYVTDKTEEEVVAKVGKPDSIDNSKSNTPRWTYKKKTFDPDYQNQIDNETIPVFQKDSSGKFKVTQVIFG
jgi:hypothetical protein